MKRTKHIDISDGITAYLRGGLGNQLFILAAAYTQAKRLSCKLYLDASWYLSNKSDTFRSFELGELNHNGFVIDTESPWAKKDPSGRKFQLLSFTRPHNAEIFFDPGYYSEEINKVNVGTTLTGYFQDPRYFQGYEIDIYEMLYPFRDVQRNKHVTVHVRRGDYLNPSTNSFHGTVSLRYLENAIQIMRESFDMEHFLVFSDSVEVVKAELQKIGGLGFSSDENKNSLDILREMSMGSGIVMSNSSFSWWAAWLITQSSIHPVIAPNPWYKNEKVSNEFYLRNWIKQPI